MVPVRSSTYRHVFGDPTRKDKCYDNIKLTKNAFDANLAKSNGKYISLNWEASGGGSFAVIPTAEQGKLPDRFPLFDGHRGAVLDTDWNPFDDAMVVSASDDGTIGIWKVPDGFSVHEDYGALDNCKDVSPVKFLEGHGKKVGHVGFNPVAANVLASSSLDNTVKVWDIESGDVLFTLKHGSFVTSFSWNYDGTKLATVAKDKKLRIWDVRKEKTISEGKGHAGAKGSRVVWLGDNDRVLTTGFSLISDREMALWDVNDIENGPLGGFRGLDPSSGIVIPHYDPMTSIVYLGGRGDGKIVYYQYADDTLYDLFAYNSTSPTRGLGWVPNRSLDPTTHEVARVYKVHETYVEPIAFRVPLKTEGFLDSIYKLVEAGEPALTAEQWKNGDTKRPLVKDWKQAYEGKDAEAKEAPKSSPESTSLSKGNGSETQKADVDSKKSPAKEAQESTQDSADKADSKSVPEKNNNGNGKSESEEKKSSAENSEEIRALEKAEKQDSNDVLQGPGVASFLAKSAAKDESGDEASDEESTWNEEPVPPTGGERSKSPVVQPSPEKTNSPEKDAPAAKEEPESQEKPERQSESPKVKDREEKETLGESKDSPKSTESKHSDQDAALLNSSGHGKLDEILRRLEDLGTRIGALEAAADKK